ETEVNRTVMLIDGDVAGGVAADRRENRGTVSEAAVIGTIDVELRTHLQSGELAIREIDRVATEKLHPVAIVFRNGEVRIGIAIEVLATIEGALRGDVGEDETRRRDDRRSARILFRRREGNGDVHVTAAVARRRDRIRVGTRA